MKSEERIWSDSFIESISVCYWDFVCSCILNEYDPITHSSSNVSLAPLLYAKCCVKRWEFGCKIAVFAPKILIVYMERQPVHSKEKGDTLGTTSSPAKLWVNTFFLLNHFA